VPIPREHVERLEADLSAHESWLRTLRHQIAALEAEASAHEMILRLGRDPNLHRALSELHDRPDMAQNIVEDPRSYFLKWGVEVPAGATVTVTADPERAAVEAHFENPPFDYGVGWSRVDGFYLVAASEPPALPDAPSRKGG
jgi:hypothetical protein